LQSMSNLDPLVAASNVYRALNENDRVRVLQVTFNPGDKAPMHRHPEHVVYVLKGGKLRLTTSAGSSSDIDLAQGQVVFLEAQNHEAINIGDSIVDLVVMELKK